MIDLYDISPDTLVQGAGDLYFDPEDASGNLTGEIDLGYTPNYTNPVSTEISEYWNPNTQTEQRALAIPRRVVRDIAFQADSISAYGLSLFYQGDATKKTQTAGSQTSIAINGGRALIGGRWYQLGQDASNPSGVRNVSAVTITADPAGTATDATVTTDYELDAAAARIKVVIGGALDGEIAESDFTLVADEREQIVTSALGAKYGALRFKSKNKNTTGKRRDVYVPRILLTPDGEAAWKQREDWMGLQFKGMILTRGTLAQVYIDGQAVATS